jgi:hypothetical protein
MSMSNDRFYIGDVPSFLMLVKIIKADPEFRLALDFRNHCLEFESMLMAGVVGVGIRLSAGPNQIVAASHMMTRTDRITLRLDSGAFLQALITLNHVPYAYMSICLNEEEDTLCLYTYDMDHIKLGSALLVTLNLEDHDTDFLVTNEDKREALVYDVMITSPGSVWKTYMQASAIDTVIRYDCKTRNIAWETNNQQTKIALYMPVSVECTTDVRVCLLPAVLTIVRGVLQFTAKYNTTLSLSDDLPVRVFAALDTNGSFIRIYAGTKDDL